MRLILNVGVNDADYKVVNYSKVSGKWVIVSKCKIYSTWTKMLRRCYAESGSHADIVVCDEWLRFSNFRNWYIDNYQDGWEIDKDILGGKTYSPDNCIMIPKQLNNCLRKVRHLETGVWYDESRSSFQAYCNSYYEGRKSLGRFKSFEDAKLAWINCKTQYIDDYIADNKVDGKLLIALSKLKDDLFNFKDLTRGGDSE